MEYPRTRLCAVGTAAMLVWAASLAEDPMIRATFTVTIDGPNPLGRQARRELRAKIEEALAWELGDDWSAEVLDQKRSLPPTDTGDR